MIIPLLLILLGLAVLVFGAEFLVKGASSVSKRFGVPSLVIGLTIVAFGTSAPELIVNLVSATKGASDLALGNIVGSNIANILLILGICTLIRELKVQKSTVWKEIPLALLAAVITFFMANDILFDGASVSVLTKSEGLILIGFFVIFLYYTATMFKNGGGEDEGEAITLYPVIPSLGMIAGGLIALFFGGEMVVRNATELARMAGLSEWLIGLTIVAVGTSLPELATSAVATKRGQASIAIGNIVGSNIFNVFWILGITGTITPIKISPVANIDLLMSIGTTLLLFVFMFLGKKHQLERWQGITFILVYVAYTAFLINRG